MADADDAAQASDISVASDAAVSVTAVFWLCVVVVAVHAVGVDLADFDLADFEAVHSAINWLASDNTLSMLSASTTLVQLVKIIQR